MEFRPFSRVPVDWALWCSSLRKTHHFLVFSALDLLCYHLEEKMVGRVFGHEVDLRPLEGFLLKGYKGIGL